MENTHEFKPVHDPLFCEEGDEPYNLFDDDGSPIKINIKSNYNLKNVPVCNPKNSCKVIQDFLEEGGVDKFSIFRSTQTECYDEIYQCQNRIESYKKKIRAEIQDIIAYKQRLDEAFNQYIE